MTAAVTAANAARYELPKLSVVQRLLLQRAHACEEPRGRVSLPLPLHIDEIPAAVGLERRGLVRTHRPTKRPFGGPPLPGSKRTLRLTNRGRAVAKLLPPAPAEPELINLPICLEMLRDLANAVVLDPEGRRARNLARSALDRIAEGSIDV